MNLVLAAEHNSKDDGLVTASTGFNAWNAV